MARKRTSRHSSRKRKKRKTGLSAFLSKPGVALGILFGLVVIGGFLILSSQSNPEAGTTGNTISVAQAYEKYQQDIFFLDVREQFEWDDYHIPDTNLIPLEELPQRLGELPSDQEIVVVCRSGNRSAEGRDVLLRAGFTNVVSMEGGVRAWYAAGYPWEGNIPQ